MRLSLTFIFSTVMIDAMGIGLIMPVMPALLQEIGSFPLSEAALWGGILAASFAVMQFAFGPIIGALSDRFGRRPILLIALFVMSLDYLVMAVAHVFWLLLLGRIIGGITAATQPTAYAAIADLSSPDEKAARFGLLGAAFGIGFVFGPMIGGLLADYGTRAPFYAAAALAAANMVLGYFVMPETVTDTNRRSFDLKRANPFGAFYHVGKTQDFRRLLLMFFFYQVAFFVYPAVWAFFTAERFGWDEGMIGLSLGVVGICMAVVQGALVPVFLKRFGEAGTVIWGLGFSMVAFLILAFLSNGLIALILTPISTLGALVTPAMQGIMSRRTADDSQGELMGVLTSTAALATIVSPLLMTSTFAVFAAKDADPYLPGAPFLVSFALMIAATLIFLSRKRIQMAQN